MATDFSHIALSGLIAMQSALNTVASNTANADTPGYSRRTVEFANKAISQFGDGVTLASIQRVYDDYAAKAVFNTTAAYNANNTYVNLGTSLQSFLTDSSSSVATNLQNMFSTLQTVNSNPSSTTARLSLYNSLNTLTQQFNAATVQLQQQNTNINQQLATTATAVNSITTEIASLNTKIASQANNTNFQNNDLLDARDKQLQQLSQYLSFSTIPQQNGTVNVVLSNGISLVQGTLSNNIAAVPLASMPNEKTIVLQQSTTNVDISSFMGGGIMGGLLNYRQQVLDPTFNQLGLLSIGLSDQFNTINKNGIDLNNVLGVNIFNDINSANAIQNRVIVNTNNTGAASLTVNVATVSALTTSDYRLTYNGPGYTLTRLSDGQTTALAAPGAYPGSLATVDGFTINITSAVAPAANDSFLITPTRNASNDMGMNITSGTQLALSSSILSSSSVNNLGTGTITSPAITNSANANFLTPLKIVFANPAVPGPVVYNIYNANTNALISANVPYTAGNNVVGVAPATINYGYNVNITGAPVAGDTFFTGTGTGNNINGLALSAVQTSVIFSNNNSLQQQSDQVTGNISASIYSQKLAKDSNNSLMKLAQSNLSSISGVNLDEEAANLTLYQQAYQANAKVFMVADTIFNALLGIFN